MRRRRARLGAFAGALASLAVLLPGTVAATEASPAPPADLRVEGGEEAWHPDNGFRLYWHNPEAGTGGPITAVHYQVRDELGEIAIGEMRIGWPAQTIENLSVPRPGAFTAEVWLEDAAGNQGAPATAKLRFDDVRPGHVDPIPSPAWIGRTAFPYSLQIGHPEGQAPVSGIRGYAVSIDGAPEGDPCVAASRCTDAETDLRGGVADDLLSIAELPEGTNYVHAVAVSGSGMKSATPGQAVLRVDETDPETRLAGAPSGWTNQAVTLTATAEDNGSGMEAGSFTAIQIDGGAPTVARGARASTTVIGEGAHLVAFYARDAAGNVNDGSTTNGLRNRPPARAVVGIDRGAPRVAFADHQDPRDPELIEVRVLDPLSGPDPSRSRVWVRQAGSGDRFEALPTEPGEAGPQARWDSDSFPPGDYEFRASGYDAAGNVATTARRSNGAPMILSNPLKTTTALRAGFSDGQSPAERSVAYGHGARFGGRLIAGLRTPLPHMPVRIVERLDPGSSPSERASTVTTGEDGRFSLRLAPGPSRKVVAVFAGSPTLSRSAARPARLAVRSGLRLRASSSVATVGGRPLVFRGAVAAAGSAIPAGGKDVELQFRLPGLPWSEFRTVQTDARGRFRYAYRFSDDDSRGVRFEFRAYAPEQGSWPYEPGGSRPVAVRGR